MSILKLIYVFILSFGQIISPYFTFMFKGIDSFYDDWSVNDEFTASYAARLDKTPGEDFVVLNFSDIQLSGEKVYNEDGEFTYQMIKDQVNEIKPDLITLSGDNSSSDVGYLELIKLLESFEIPWAPIMGNHDGDNGNRIKEAWDAYYLSNAEHCLFKFGPKGMGYGNYIINVYENDKIVHTFFMMDTHSDAGDTDAGTINYGGKDAEGKDIVGYDHLWANQIEWYKWAVNGIAKLNGSKVESTVIYHIPNIEYRIAVKELCDNNPAADDEKEENIYFPKAGDTETIGSIGENICSPEGNNGFFAVVKELGSTKNIIAGHDHKNNISILYDGVYLDFSLKSGKGSYWWTSKLGCSLLTVGNNGVGTFSHEYYDK